MKEKSTLNLKWYHIRLLVQKRAFIFKPNFENIDFRNLKIRSLGTRGKTLPHCMCFVKEGRNQFR